MTITLSMLFSFAGSSDKQIQAQAREQLEIFRKQNGASGMEQVISGYLNVVGNSRYIQEIVRFVVGYGKDVIPRLRKETFERSCSARLARRILRRLGKTIGPLLYEYTYGEYTYGSKKTSRKTRRRLLRPRSKRYIPELIQLGRSANFPDKNWGENCEGIQVAKALATYGKDAVPSILRALRSRKNFDKGATFLYALGLIQPVSEEVEALLVNELLLGNFFAAVALELLPQLRKKSAEAISQLALDDQRWRDGTIAKEESRQIAMLFSKFGKHRRLAVKPIISFADRQVDYLAYHNAVKSAGTLRLEDPELIELISNKIEGREDSAAELFALLNMGKKGREFVLRVLRQPISIPYNIH